MWLFSRLRAAAARGFIRWLTIERLPDLLPEPWDPSALGLQPGDVLLFEGHARVSEIIKSFQQSTWSHAALYIGTGTDLERLGLRPATAVAWEVPRVLEVLLGRGVVLTPLTEYARHRMRVCRARDLADPDRAQVLGYALARLGQDYDLRQLFDLARLILPWALLPRRWHSSLFREVSGSTARTVCSALIAEAFQAVDYPVLPIVVRDIAGSEHWHKRNPRLYTPRDFDLSPFFDVVKAVPDGRGYRALPWEPVFCNDARECASGVR